MSNPTGKLLRVVLQFARGAWVVARHFPVLDTAQRHAAVQQWARQTLAVLDIAVHANQAPPQGFAGLVVCNHLSWLDVLVLQSLMPVCFVAKSEVRRWPLVGYLAAAAATIFVDRSSVRSAHAMVAQTAQAIGQGAAVVVFPEGTSSAGASLGPFHANIFEAAIRQDAPVQLLTLQYHDGALGTVATAAHFTGDTTLLASLCSVAAASGMQARVHIGECLLPQGHTRKSLSLQAHQKMSRHLHAPAPGASHEPCPATRPACAQA